MFLEVQDLHMGFRGVQALQGVSFHVNENELFAIIGPNGAGKTTIFNIINGVYKPQWGGVFLRGKEITHMKSHHVAEIGIARTFQNIELFRNMSVIDNLLLGRHLFLKSSFLAGSLFFGKCRKEEIANRKRVEEVIEFLEIEEARKQLVRNLPYGLQKRVELGRALCMNPLILLLDEPVAGMNLEEKEDIARFILDIKEEMGATIIMIDHDMEVVMDIADRVCVIDFGVKVTEGEPKEVQNEPKVIKAYLGES
jgi:branched-chain amino acid transport system ATP-binding protein